MYSISLKVQARCSHGTGRGTGAQQYFGRPVHAQAYAAAADPARGRRVLLINKEHRTNTIEIEGLPATSRGTLHAVDGDSMGGGVSSADGIRASEWRMGRHEQGRVTLAPFAVAVLALDDDS